MITIKDKTFSIVIKYKNIKNMYLRLKEDTIEVTANYLISKEKIISFINSKEKWIYEHYQKNVLKPQNIDITMGKIRLFGLDYELRINIQKKIGWKLEENRLYIFSKYNENEKIEIIIHKALQALLKEQIQPMITKWNIIFERDPTIVIKHLKSKWGICYVNSNKIVLSSNLAHYPLAAINAVILHEYAHFRCADHSAKFYEIVYNYMQDYDAYKKLLN